jgi:hypothetical protein
VCWRTNLAGRPSSGRRQIAAAFGGAIVHPVSTSNESKGPYIKAAVFCERVLEEKDNVLSAIRIFDRSAAEIELAEDDEEVPGIEIRGHLMVAIVAGESLRKQAVTVRLLKPSGETVQLAEFPIEFGPDEDAAAQLILKLAIGVTQEGIFWFEILTEDAVRTRIPLRVSKTIKRRS